MWFVCVSEGVITHSPCCPSSYLPPAAAHRNLPVAACSSLVHTHCQCPSVHEQTVSSCGSCQISQRAALSHLWFGFNPNNPRVAHWVTWWSNWMGSWCSGPCRTLQCLYLFLFPLWGVLLPSATVLGHTDHRDEFSAVSRVRVRSHYSAM